MAKSVLDLYELYNLVVARGGLVEVINKKLWQEIIKGLHLPSSITSAAFTLRSQYMKYLFPYELEKEGLSTPEELNTAIESNRREGRRTSYVAYPSNANENLQSAIQRNQHAQNSLALHHSMPMSLAAQMAAVAAGPSSLVANGRSHTPLQHQSHPSQHAQPSLASIPSEYMLKMLGQDVRNIISAESSSMLQRHPSASSPTMPEALSKVTDYRIGHFWNMCHNNNNNSKIYPTQSPLSPSALHSPLAPANSPEPQREALDLASSTIKSEPSIGSPLAVSSPSASNVITSKRSYNDTASPIPPSKRVYGDENFTIASNIFRVNQSTFEEGGRKRLHMCVDINGVTYKGVLAADDNSASNSPETDNNATDNVDAKSSQNISS
ncbi:Protein dead ringer [Ooceraea biroi]|uniref:Protein dead ringer n=2 Tax=Ooceraea biroi TaxID=2015173 RepID=A0A026VWB7_OOCBI|nr:Protein dead ringer [Ooceraea biroi]